jgi:hypothetical protein
MILKSGPGDSQTRGSLREKRYRNQSITFVFGMKIYSHTKHIATCVELLQCNAVQGQHMQKAPLAFLYKTDLKYGMVLLILVYLGKFASRTVHFITMRVKTTNATIIHSIY